MPNNSSLGFRVANAISRGDVDRAHELASGRRSWAVSEARAIIHACRLACERYTGCSVSFLDFC